MVSSTGYCVLASLSGMLAVRSLQLHQHSLKLQPPTGACTDRLEDTDGFHSSCSSDCSDMRIVVNHKRVKSVNVPIKFVEFVDKQSSCLSLIV